MLSVFPWDTIKYRCGEERQAVILSKRVHLVFYLSGRADCARTPTHTQAEKDRMEKRQQPHSMQTTKMTDSVQAAQLDC